MTFFRGHAERIGVQLSVAHHILQTNHAGSVVAHASSPAQEDFVTGGVKKLSDTSGNPANRRGSGFHKYFEPTHCLTFGILSRVSDENLKQIHQSGAGNEPDSETGPHSPAEDTHGVKRKPKDKPLHLKRHVVIWFAALALLGIMAALAQAPSLVEKVYTHGIGQVLSRFLSGISRPFPFSLFELLLVVVVVYVIASPVLAIRNVIKRRRGILNVAGCVAIKSVTAVLVLLTAFYLAWGLNYARPALVERLQWQESEVASPTAERLDIEPEELARLCEELVNATNQAYATALGAEDVGEPSKPPPFEKTGKVIDRAYERLAEHIGLENGFAKPRGPAKPVLASMVMNRMLILGFYSPWTGEANFNRLAPGSKLPHTIAHEKAHQRGIAGEDEANFFGYLACAFSDHPYVRYSGYLFAQGQLLAELRRVNKDQYARLASGRFAGVKRDIEEQQNFFRKHRGKISKASSKVNDVYLRANRVEGGIQSYRLSSKLLVLYARQNEGSCVKPGQSRAARLKRKP